MEAFYERINAQSERPKKVDPKDLEDVAPLPESEVAKMNPRQKKMYDIKMKYNKARVNAFQTLAEEEKKKRRS